jgi:integrase
MTDRNAFDAQPAAIRALLFPIASDAPAGVSVIQRTTFRELMVLYDGEVLSRRPSGASVRRSLAFVIEPLAEKLCSEFSLEDILPILDAIAVDAPVHANRIHAYCSALFGWACRNGFVDYNPFYYAFHAQKETPRERILNLNEIAEIWSAAEKLGWPFGPAIQILILTVARREQVGAMLKRDIGKQRPESWSVLARNRGGRSRLKIPLSPPARRIIWGVWDKSPPDQNLIFTTTGSTPISGWSRAKRRLDAAILERRLATEGDRAIAMPSWRLNDLQRSFFDLSIQHLGEDPMVLGRCLNRMTEFKTPRQREWVLLDDMFELRQDVLVNWAALIEEAVALQTSATPN